MSTELLNENEFKQSFGVLQTYFGKTLKPEVIKLYWQRLSKLTRHDFAMALTNIRDNYRPTSQNPFPLIADFLQACNQTGRNRAQDAIKEVQDAIKRIGAYESVDFGDRALHAVIQRFGGWSEICHWTQKDWNINEGRFLQAYEAACLNPNSGPEYLHGVFEAENSLRTDKIAPPVKTGKVSKQLIGNVVSGMIERND